MGQPVTPIELQPLERYGKLIVLRKVRTKRGYRYSCGCACGRRCAPNATQLMKGRVTSCGRCT